jgi:chemoreceptor zinc-binding protein
MSLADEIKKAIGAHGTWKWRLKVAIDVGDIDVQISTILADNECSLGKWLYGPTIPEKEKKSSHYQKVREAHAVFHEQAARVVELAMSDNKAGAMKMLEVNGAFTMASAAFTTAMIAWLKVAK